MRAPGESDAHWRQRVQALLSDPADTRSLADREYVATQKLIELLSASLIDPEILGGDTLDRFIERAERSMTLGPVLHPSEFRDGVDKLAEVLAHARALRLASHTIAKASR